MKGYQFHYLKTKRGAKTPDFLVEQGDEAVVVEIGGKGREQFKGIKVGKKLILSHSPEVRSNKKPLSLLVFIDLPFVEIDYSNSLSIRLAFSLLAVTMLIYSFEYLRIENIKKLDQALEEANIESKTRDEFISKLSHQLRTSLNNITLVSNLVSETLIDEKQRDLIDTILASSNNLVEAVNTIVKVSHVDIRELKTSEIPFDLISSVESILQLFGDKETSNFNLSIRQDNTLTNQVLGDPIRIKQFFLNLIENIIKDEKENHNISIEIEIVNEKRDG